ncbi:MAG: hypothetical protein ACR2QH_14705 [Geminicoccaceae bacterium]
MTDIKDALEKLKAGGCTLGPAWEQAHQLAQSREGDVAYDRLHALVHRIEGDLSNAAYWYRRSGEEPYQGDIASEVDLLIVRLSKT